MAQQKPVKKTKKSSNPADSYPPMKDERGVPTIGGGEGTTPPFTKAEMEYKKKMTGLPKGKMGKTISKAKNGKPVKKAFLGAALPIAMKALPMLGGMLGGKGKGGGLGGMLGGLLGGKNGKTIKKSRSGSSLGARSVKSGYDKNYSVTRADFIPKKAKSGSKMKMGGTIKKAQTGTVQSANQQTQSNVNKIAMKNAGDSIQKSAAGAAKNGKSMKKCKYGCK